MIIFPSSRRQGFPTGFEIPVNVIVNMTWGFIHHTAPNPWICLDSLFEFCFLHLAHSKHSLKVKKKLKPFLATHQRPNENSNKSHQQVTLHDTTSLLLLSDMWCYTMPNNLTPHGHNSAVWVSYNVRKASKCLLCCRELKYFESFVTIKCFYKLHRDPPYIRFTSSIQDQIQKPKYQFPADSPLNSTYN